MTYFPTSITFIRLNINGHSSEKYYLNYSDANEGKLWNSLEKSQVQPLSQVSASDLKWVFLGLMLFQINLVCWIGLVFNTLEMKLNSSCEWFLLFQYPHVSFSISRSAFILVIKKFLKPMLFSDLMGCYIFSTRKLLSAFMFYVKTKYYKSASKEAT